MKRSHPAVYSALLGLGCGLLTVALYEVLSGDPVDATTVGRFIGFAVAATVFVYLSIRREAAQRDD